MIVRRRQPPDQQRKPTRVRQSEIVDAAMHIIASRGSRHFTAKLVASKVGVSPGAIYRHFPCMDAILDGVVDRVEEILFDGFPPDAGDPLERLGIFFVGRVRAVSAHPDLSRLLLSDHLAHACGRARAKRLAGFKRRSRDFVLGCLREAEDAGMLGGVADPQEGTVLVLGSILALAHEGVRVTDQR